MVTRVGWACLACHAAVRAVAAQSRHGCSDPAASNYDSMGPVTAAAQFNNSGCMYTCRLLCSYFGVDCAHGLCLLDNGTGSNWTNTNSTLYASLGTSLLVQGRAEWRESHAGRTQLQRRIESTSAGGATVILRHIAMIGLHADSDSLGNFRDGGAIQVQRSNLTIEHCIFAHNKADGGGAVKASGTIRIFNTLFENNTALNSGGAVYATGLLGPSSRTLLGAQMIKETGGSSIVLTGCAFINNSAANYGGALYVKNDQMLQRFNSWIVSGCRGVGNYGEQLASALVWQGAQFVAVQDDALLVGIDDLWAYVSMRPDGPYNGLGCLLDDLPPNANLGQCASTLNDTVLPDRFRCALGCNTQRFGASNTDQWSTTKPEQCYEGVYALRYTCSHVQQLRLSCITTSVWSRYVWSSTCAERRCASPSNATGLYVAPQDVGDGVCAHNGSCWVFPPRLSGQSMFAGPAEYITASRASFAQITRTEEQDWIALPRRQGDQVLLHSDEPFAFNEESSSIRVSASELKVCDCPPGWWGARCHRLDLCIMADTSTRLTVSTPRCKHGGNCTRLFDGTAGYMCTCPVGYGGRVCEITPWETGEIVATAAMVCFWLPVLWVFIARRWQLGRQAREQEGRELASPLLS